MHKKNVLFLSHEASTTGAPIFFKNLVSGINKRALLFNFSVLFAQKGLVADQLKKDGLKVFVLEKLATQQTSKINKFFIRLKYYFYYTKILNVEKIDLVYANTIMNFGEVFIAWLLRKKIILHCHEGYEFSKNFKHQLKISCMCADKIIVGSHYANQSIEKLTGFKGSVIYNGVTLEAKNINETKIKEGTFTLGILATINFNKGQLVALKALRLLIDEGIDVRLQIAGLPCDDKYLREIHDFISINKLEGKVNILGFVPDSDAFLKSLDLLLVPSYDEVFPTVILEAFALGIPVIASDAGGIPEIIDDKNNAYLFKPGDHIGLAEIIGFFISNQNIKVKIVRNARNKIQSNFDFFMTIHKVVYAIHACFKR